MSYRICFVVRFILMFPLSVAATKADEAAAVAAIEKSGGHVRRIAADVDWNEVSFHLAPTPVTDEALASLTEIPALRWLSLQGTNLTDEMLRHVAPLTQLTRLHLERTGIGDAGLVHLAPLANLEYLNLYGTKVSDGGIEALGQLKSLKQLYVWQSQISDEGIARLKTLLPSAMIMGAATFKPLSFTEAGAEVPATITAPAFATAQYIRVELPGTDKYLQLAEVEVFEATTGTPLQVEGLASQSSTGFLGEAQRAADGKTDANFNGNSVTHTALEANPWWELDLGSKVPIGSLRIWNRGDCCGERLVGAKVLVLDSDRKELHAFTIDTAETGSRHVFPSGG